MGRWRIERWTLYGGWRVIESHDCPDRAERAFRYWLGAGATVRMIDCGRQNGYGDIA